MWAGVQLLLFLIVTGTGLYFAAKVIYARYSYIRLGQPASVPYTIKERLKAFAAEIFGQTKLLKDRKSGWMHVIIFYGFLIVQLGAIDLIYKGIAGKPLPIPGYSVFFAAAGNDGRSYPARHGLCRIPKVCRANQTA